MDVFGGRVTAGDFVAILDTWRAAEVETAQGCWSARILFWLWYRRGCRQLKTDSDRSLQRPGSNARLRTVRLLSLARAAKRKETPYR